MVRLDRTRAETLSYYARTRSAKALSALLLCASLAGVGVWQYPNAAAAVEGWAVQLSGRDELLVAQSELSDTLAEAAAVAARVPEASGLDTSTLTQVIDECESTRTAGDPATMLDCAQRMKTATDTLAGQVERYTTASQILALEKQAQDAQRARDEAAAAQRAAEEKAKRDAAERAAQAEADAAAKRAEDDRRNTNTTAPAPQQPAPQPAPPVQQGSTPSKPSAGGSGSTLSTTVTCNSRQTVTATASGGGTVTVTITGAGSASRSGSGSATASATGQGTFTVTAKSTAGGLSLNPSWTGACW